MLDKEHALAELRQLVQGKRWHKGVPYGPIGLGYGKSMHNVHASMSWGHLPLETHRLEGLLVHREKMSLSRIRWHLNHYEELISGYRPMHLCVDGDRKFIFDGCHRTVALLIVGFEEFEFKVCRAGE